jgi:choloylglycine hydrolase
MKIKNASFALAALALSLFASPSAQTCSRILWSDSGKGVVVGRTMDWFEDTKTNLWIFPRGLEHDGGVGENSLHWKSKYGSVVAPIYDIATTDGINEKGLSANLLYLTESDYGKRDVKIPGMSIAFWAQFFLDSFATVDEAVKYMEINPLQLVEVKVGSTGAAGTGHLAISDPTGDSAVFEYLDGKLKMYHGKQYQVMTNSPPYEEQLKNLKKYKGFGGNKPLPGSSDAADRFVRAATYLKDLPTPTDDRENIAYLLSVVRDVSAPFGVSEPGKPNIAATRWRTVIDMTDKVYYFESTINPTIVWIDLNKVNFKAGAPVKELNLVLQPDHIGDVSTEFVTAKPFTFLTPTLSSN